MAERIGRKSDIEYDVSPEILFTAEDEAPEVDGVAEDEERLRKIKLDERALAAWDYLNSGISGRGDGLSYFELMDGDTEVDGLRNVRNRVERHDGSTHVLYISDILVGSKLSDPNFLCKVVDNIKEQLIADRPDVVVVSGLLIGDFGGRNKKDRAMLDPDLPSLQEQFKRANEVVNKIQELGVPVVYSLSDHDHEIIREMAFAYSEELRSAIKAGDSDDPEIRSDLKRQLTKRQRDEADPHWENILRTTQYVLFPYCLRKGGYFATAREIESISGGEVIMSERELLIQAYQLADSGSVLDETHQTYLDKAALENAMDIEVADDFRHKIETVERNGAKRADLDLIRHRYWRTASNTQTPIGTMQRVVGKVMGSSSEYDDVRNFVATGGGAASGMLLPDGGMLLTTGTLQDHMKALSMGGRQLVANKIATPLTGAGRLNRPNIISVKNEQDGRVVIPVYTDRLMEVSEKVKERTSIVMLCDWQVGNLAARPDLQIKFIDMVKELLTTQKVIVALGGDFIEGRNYPDYQRSSARTGMGGLDQQLEFVRTMLSRSLDGLTVEQVGNLYVVGTIGNHEWNSGTMKTTGDSLFSNFEAPWREQFARHGYSYDEINDRVSMGDHIITPNTNAPISTYSSIFRFGDGPSEDDKVVMEVRHFFGGGGGYGGNLPIDAVQKMAEKQGDLRRKVDISLMGHFHYPNFSVIAGALGVTNGALNEITGFEYGFGLRATVGFAMVHVGGQRPVEVEFVPQHTMANWKIKEGWFSDREIREREGFKNQRGSHPIDSPYGPIDRPKTALAQMALRMGQLASYSSGRGSYL